MKLQLAESKY